MICQAAAAAMRSLLHDWHLMVAQLEHQFRTGYLSVQALWFYCQEPQSSLALLAAIAAEAASKRLRGAGESRGRPVQPCPATLPPFLSQKGALLDALNNNSVYRLELFDFEFNS
jgi:hypothetical protein